MNDLGPRALTTTVDDLEHLAQLAETAIDGGVAVLALEPPPARGVEHVLQVSAPALETPLLLRVEASDARTSQGLYPCRLRPMRASQVDELRRQINHWRATAATHARALLPAEGWQPAEDATAGTLVSASTPHRASQRPRDADFHRSALPGRTLGGKYEIDALLAEGAMGKVFRGRHIALGKPVAIKVIRSTYHGDATYQKRFRREALAASQLDHPNVLRTLDFGEEDDGQLYIVMELVEGQSLRRVLERDKVLPLPRTVAIVSQVCSALAAAHDRGVIHRDIKPENIIVFDGRDEEGRPAQFAKVCDFGVARIAGSQDESVTDLTVIGTPDYMSPEQARGEALDARCDIYACGVLLFEMAVGTVPFPRKTPMAVLVAHSREDAPVPSRLQPGIDRGLEAVILKALSKDSGKRHDSARTLRAELRAALERSAQAVRISYAPPSHAPSPSSPLAGAPAQPPAAVPGATLRPAQELFPVFFEQLAAAVEGVRAVEAIDQAMLDRLARAAAQLLRQRGEVTIARPAHDSCALVVRTGVGESASLQTLASTPGARAFAARLGQIFGERRMVSLTLREGLAAGELRDAALLVAATASFDAIQQTLRAATTVAAIFEADLVGLERRLPYSVVLALSRLARDLGLLGDSRAHTTLERRRNLGLRFAANAVALLDEPEEAEIAIANLSLVEQRWQESAALDTSHLAEAIVGALPQTTCVRMARKALDDIVLQRAFSGAAADVAERIAIVQLVGHRFLRQRSRETDELVRELVARSLLSFADLPQELLHFVRIEEYADRVAANTEGALRALDAAVDRDRYSAQARALSSVVPALARRGKVGSLAAILARLDAHAASARPDADGAVRAALATEARSALEDSAVLLRAADALLGRSPSDWQPAWAVLQAFGARAARALCRSRRGGQADAGVRARFSEALRRTGDAGLNEILSTLAACEAGDADLIEDLLRAIPDSGAVAGETGVIVATMAARFACHSLPAVRRAALDALASACGDSARSALVGSLDDRDDDVRIAALSGLRRIGAVDAEVVACIAGMLAAQSPASDAVRSAAASALSDAKPAARPAAARILRRTIDPAARPSSGAAASDNGGDASTWVVEAVARALLAVGGDEGRRAVERRALEEPPGLRERLQALLGASSF